MGPYSHPSIFHVHVRMSTPESGSPTRPVGLILWVVMQLLKNREEVFQSKSGAVTKDRKRSKYKSDEVESMDKVQLLGEAFQKIQMATGIHV